MYATWLTHLIFIYVITLVFGEESNYETTQNSSIREQK
jgi:hypothetical protein